MGLLKLLFGIKEAEDIKQIEDDLHYVYGYSRKKLEAMSNKEKKNLWYEEEEHEYEDDQ